MGEQVDEIEGVGHDWFSSERSWQRYNVIGISLRPVNRTGFEVCPYIRKCYALPIVATPSRC